MMNFKPNEDYGDLIPIAEWKDSVEFGAFIPYDGSGYYSNGTEYVHELSVWEYPVPTWATHVLWFNK